MKNISIEETASGGVSITITDGGQVKHLNLSPAEFKAIQPKLNDFKKGDVDLNELIPGDLPPNKEEISVSDWDNDHDWIPD
jgi:hypothetical protein